MKKTSFVALAVAAAVPSAIGTFAASSSASGAHVAAASPAHADATAALGGAKTAVRSAAVAGLIKKKAVAFTFSSSAGTCPPGTSDASYCVGASGKLIFTVVLSTQGKSAVHAVSTNAQIGADTTVSVKGQVDGAGVTLLRYAKAHKLNVDATLTAEAVLSSTSYNSATTSVKIK